MSKAALQKILEHPDKNEIISKLVIGIPPKDVSEWLGDKYTNANEAKFVFSEKTLVNFKTKYLDIYQIIQEDLAKTKTAIATSSEDDLKLTLKNVSAYKNMLIQTANEELDIRKIVKNLCHAIEHRLTVVFDRVEENPDNLNTRMDRLLLEYAETLGNLLEKYYKFTEQPSAVAATVQHNVTLQVVDQHITVMQDVIKDVLSQIDTESSLLFMDKLNTAMAKLKAPEPEAVVPSDMRLAEAKILSETINKRING